ncbi:MAG: rod-binding protein [Acetobacteraceae bacterium]|nr:rod-binding protein [Acetobacteraceae bacterium]
MPRPFPPTPRPTCAQRRPRATSKRWRSARCCSRCSRASARCGPFGGGAAEAMWRPVLVNEIARAIADAGGLGIAEMVLRQMGGFDGGGR